MIRTPNTPTLSTEPFPVRGGETGRARADARPGRRRLSGARVRPDSRRLAVPSGRTGLADRRRGIALLVVMVVFVILYLVVFHLDYWTRMEAHVANVRASEAQSIDALWSAMVFVSSILVEDLKQDLMEGGAGGAAGAGRSPMGDGGEEGMGEPAPDPADSANFVPINAPAGAQGGATGGSSHVDYKLENVFQDTTQEIGEISVKGRIVDNESKLNLNRLFDIALLIRQTQEAGTPGGPGGALPGVSEDELADAVLGAGNDAEAEENLATIAQDGGAMSRIRDGGEGGPGVGRANREGDDPGTPAVADELTTQLGLQEDVELTKFTEPTSEAIQDTQEVLRRAVQFMLSTNESWGYEYEEHYQPDEIAGHIIEYVLARRRSPIQNIIYHPSELLNIYSITPELYYGPKVPIYPDESENVVFVEDQWGEAYEFLLSRDEFGDIVAEPIAYDDAYAMEQEFQREQLQQLQESFGQFANFPSELGLGRLNQSSLTRGMSEPATKYDEDGNGIIVEPPLPLGLEDLFCAFSTGRINVNTAPVPVLFALLLSLEAGVGEAQIVANQINDYRNRMQDYMEEEEGEIDRVDEVPNLGQPRRQREEELLDEDAPFDPSLLEFEELMDAGSAYEDLASNYFTNLSQIELIDGADGGPDDLITSQGGVDRVSAELDTLYRRILNDYSNVVVFGSTYFTVELKAKTKKSPLVKTGTLVVKRDAKAKLMEVVLWKELN